MPAWYITISLFSLPCFLVLFAIIFSARRQNKQRDILLRYETRFENLQYQLELQTRNMDDKLRMNEEILQRFSENFRDRQINIQELLLQKLNEILQIQQNHGHQLQQAILENFTEHKIQLLKQVNELRENLQQELKQHRLDNDKHQLTVLTALQETIQKSMYDVRSQIAATLLQNSETIGQRLEKLTQETNFRLKEISGQVERRLAEGFEKTTATFTDVLKRLALIDEAQKRITELSSNVISLQEVLADKRSRGAFGEVQLSGLIRNVMPESCFSFQFTLSNQKRADCMLFLPEPTGNIAIDAKFPLESYRRMMDVNIAESERRASEQQFRQDIRKHIQDIAEKYIIAGETADGAIMFIPAEAIFAEIHGHYPDLVELAQNARVWIASPTTMMAILTTARAVLKDADTRKQVHVIQEHLSYLAKDFDRFQKRMDNLSRHIQQAHDDVKEVNTSALKISNRFRRIEKVDLEPVEEEKIELIE